MPDDNKHDWADPEVLLDRIKRVGSARRRRRTVIARSGGLAAVVLVLSAALLVARPDGEDGSTVDVSGRDTRAGTHVDGDATPTTAADGDAHRPRVDDPRAATTAEPEPAPTGQAPAGRGSASTSAAPASGLPNREFVARIAGGDLFVSRVDGSDRRTVSSGVSPAPFAWAPIGDRIAAWPAGVLRVVEARSGRERTIAAAVERVAWSSDGSEIAYVVDGALWVASIAAGVPRRIASDVNDIAWAPHTTAIAYSAGCTRLDPASALPTCTGNAPIRIVSSTGGPSSIARGPGSSGVDASPSWSPNQRWVSFERRTDRTASHPTVHVYDVEAGTEHEAGSGEGVRWTRSGAAFIDRSRGPGTLMWLDGGSLAVTRLTESAVGCYAPDSRGNAVVYEALRNVERDTWTVQDVRVVVRDRPGEKVLTSEGSFDCSRHGEVWSSAGSAVGLVLGSRNAVLDVASGDVARFEAVSGQGVQGDYVSPKFPPST
jgi:hypothetical protein